MFSHQSKICPKKRRSLYYYQSLISYHIPAPPSEDLEIHLVFHATLLSPYHKNNVHGLNFPNPPPDLIAGEEEYEIDQILHHRGSLSRQSFLI